MKIIILSLVFVALGQLAYGDETIKTKVRTERAPRWDMQLTSLTFIQAKDACEAIGAQLATIESAEDELDVLRYIQRTPELVDEFKRAVFYVGRNDLLVEGEFFNIDGTASNNYGWCPGEPNSEFGNQDCTVYETLRLCQDDYDCNSARYFLCEH